MGLMNKLRDKTHIILIVLIVAFLATIVFEWGMDYLGVRGGQVTELGSVNGQEIKIADFENQVNFAIEQQRQQTGEDPDETVIQMIRDQVWDQMVTQIIAEQEIKRLGITVTNQEILNWVYNSPQTLPEVIRKNFVDSTGQFNMTVYQQALSTKTPEVQKFWSQVEEYLKQTLLSQKLQSVITGTVRVTEGEVMQKFKDDNIKATFDFVFLDVNSVQDNIVQINDEDLKAYYDSHKDEFRREESAKVKYVLFQDGATAEDTLYTEKQLRSLVKDLKKMNPNDSTTYGVVNDNSMMKFTNVFIKPNELAPEVLQYLFNGVKDSVSDVIKASDGLHIVRMIDSKESDVEFSNASHILVNFGTDTAAAKQKTDQIMARLKAGEDFGKLARELSEDPGSKDKGGDLGWFGKGAMVKEFEDAVNKAAIGETVGPIKSQFGFHIIKVKNRAKKEFKVADIKQVVKPTAKTKDAARKKAEDFAFICKSGNFEDEAKKLGLQIIEMPNFVTKGGFVQGAGQSQAISKFALGEKKGSVSDPIKIQNGYAVYLITEQFPSGYYSFDEVKGNLLPGYVKIQKKLDYLKPQAEDLRSKVTGDLNSLKSINPQIVIQSADTSTVSAPNPIVGNDMEFNSVVYKMQNGQISNPIRTNRGYFIVHMKTITPFDQTKYQQEFQNIQNTMITQKKQTIMQEWVTELKNKAVIVDNRDKFFR